MVLGHQWWSHEEHLNCPNKFSLRTLRAICDLWLCSARVLRFELINSSPNFYHSILELDWSYCSSATGLYHKENCTSIELLALLFTLDWHSSNESQGMLAFFMHNFIRLSSEILLPAIVTRRCHLPSFPTSLNWRRSMMWLLGVYLWCEIADTRSCRIV